MNRKPLLTSVFIALYLLVFIPAFSQEAARTIRLLLIGNSFSQNASRYLPDLAKESGIELIIGRAELGGCSLQRHWEIVEAHEADPDDPKGKQYRGKSLKMLLLEQEWDYVTIQQNSMNSTDLSTYRPYARNLYDYIKKFRPDAEVVLHQTWAYRVDSNDFGRINEKEHTRNAEEMYKRSRANYHTIAKELGIRILPVGDAFWMINTHPRFAFKKDPTFNYEHPAQGALPVQTYSLHRGYFWKDGENKISFDSHHANEAGEFLGALVWSGVLFGESPAKLKFKPKGIPNDFDRALKRAAKKVVKTGRVASDIGS